MSPVYSLGVRLIAAAALTHTLALALCATALATHTHTTAGPSSVTVKQGTHTHGNASSLNEIDGDTFDVNSAPARKSYQVIVILNYAGGRILDWGASAQPRTTCSFIQTGVPHGLLFRTDFGPTLSTGHDDIGSGILQLKLKCKASSPFSLSLDELTLSNP